MNASKIRFPRSSYIFLISSLAALLAAAPYAQTISVTPASLAFGSVVSGATTALTATVTNTGAGVATITGIELGGSTIFTRSGGTCATAFPANLAAGANCSVFIKTGLAIEGPYFAALNVRTATALSSTPISATITRAPVLPRVSVLDINFGLASSPAGFNSRRIEITNNRDYPVNFSTISGSPFAANNAATTPTRYLTTGSCFTSLNFNAPLIPTLNLGASCYIDILPILPNTVGNYDSTITIATSEGPLNIPVNARLGAAPDALVIEPATIALGSVAANTTVSLYVTFTNNSSTATKVEGLLLPSGVEMVGENCLGQRTSRFTAFEVPAQSSCAMILNVSIPATTGNFATEIVMASPKGNLTIPVSASVVQPGTPPIASVSSLNFGASGDRTTPVYPTYTVTFTNTTATSVSLVGFGGGVAATVGNNPLALFRKSGSCYVSADINARLQPSLAPGGSCSVSIAPRLERPLDTSVGASVSFVIGGTISLITSAGASNVSVRAATAGRFTSPLVAQPARTALTRPTISSASNSQTVSLVGSSEDTIDFVHVPPPFIRSGGTCPSVFPAVATPGCTMIFSVPANAPPASTNTIYETAVVVFATTNRPINLILVTGTPAATSDEDNDGIPYAVELAEGRDPFYKDNEIFYNGFYPSTTNRWFAMQQYRDFLSREADAAGLAGWTNLLNTSMTREAVIQGFFGSPEFQSGVPSVVRLYLGFFKRIPDSAGLKGWVSAVRAGAPLGTVASAFAQSAEFQLTYGALTNAQFVTLVYQNVLGRVPDTAGYNGWLAQLQGGLSRGDMMVGFTESTEFQLQTSPNVFVIMMYEGMLRRAAEQAGYDFWVNYVNSGKDALDLTRGFLNSIEYRNRFLP